MSQQTLERLMARYTDDPQFKEQLKRDPEGAARQAGVELDEEDRRVLQQLDWSLPDEELQQRVSKGYR